MTHVTPEPIMKIASGFMAAKHLFVASEIGLFAALADGPATIDDLAAKCGIPGRTLRISADAMVSLGLVGRQGDKYKNGETAAAFLAGQPGFDMRPMMSFWNRISYPAWVGLEKAVRTGEGQSHFHSFDDEEQRIFSMGVEAISAPMAAALAGSYDFGRHKRVLDVGGGTGSFLLAALHGREMLNGTLFELPGACEVARKRLAEEPDGPRIEVIAGDFFKDPLPKGHDAVLVVNTAHVLSADHNLALLKQIRDCVDPAARLLLVDFWTDPTHVDPPLAPLISGEFLVLSGEGQAYSEAEANDWLGQTGWRKIERTPLVGASSVIVAEAA